MCPQLLPPIWLRTVQGVSTNVLAPIYRWTPYWSGWVDGPDAGRHGRAVAVMTVTCSVMTSRQRWVGGRTLWEYARAGNLSGKRLSFIKSTARSTTLSRWRRT